MRIALVTEYYYPHLGGVTEHVYNLARELQRHGHPTIVVTANMDRPPRCADLDHDAGDDEFVRRVGTSRTIYSAGSFARVTTGIGLRRALRELFRRERIDIAINRAERDFASRGQFGCGDPSPGLQSGED